MRWLPVCFLLLLTPAYAVQPDEVLPNPQLEARARSLSEGFRCLVCQNQSIDESDAALARDLRLLIRERLTKGDSDAQVTDFIVARYGDYVLLKPRFNTHTVLLWTTPFLIIIISLCLLPRWRKNQIATAETPLSKEEQAALQDILP